MVRYTTRSPTPTPNPTLTPNPSLTPHPTLSLSTDPHQVRKHARRGSYNSFVAEYESRLDRFLYRINVCYLVITP